MTATPEAIIATRGKPGPKPRFLAGNRVCTQCGQPKTVDQFVPIKGTKAGYYGACRRCRTKRAWERNHTGERYEDWLAGNAESKLARPTTKTKPPTRTCSDCQVTKPLSEFTRILWNQKSTGFQDWLSPA